MSVKLYCLTYFSIFISSLIFRKLEMSVISEQKQQTSCLQGVAFFVDVNLWKVSLGVCNTVQRQSRKF